MFEKEAEEYTESDIGAKYLSTVVAKDKLHAYKLGQYDGFIQGSEFGYNKANEWHYVKDGDLPKTEGSYYVAMDNGRGYKSGAILNWVEETDCEEDFHWEDDDYECYDEQVYAWRECLVLPPKEE